MFLFLQLCLELLFLLLITFYEGQVLILSESILNHQHPFFSINSSKEVILVDAISSFASQYMALNTLK